VTGRDLRLLLERAGLPRIRFHHLRHTAATLLLASGTHPKLVQELLGHSTIALTLDVYSHVTPTMHDEAANTMAGYCSGSFSLTTVSTSNGGIGGGTSWYRSRDSNSNALAGHGV
jgi:Phage integrase family